MLKFIEVTGKAMTAEVEKKVKLGVDFELKDVGCSISISTNLNQLNSSRTSSSKQSSTGGRQRPEGMI